MVEQIEGFHLSAEQKYLWSALRNKQSNYVLGLVQIPKDISTEKLQQSVINVIHDNEILRTCFRALPGMAFSASGCFR